MREARDGELVGCSLSAGGGRGSRLGAQRAPYVTPWGRLVHRLMSLVIVTIPGIDTVQERAGRRVPGIPSQPERVVASPNLAPRVRAGVIVPWRVGPAAVWRRAGRSGGRDRTRAPRSPGRRVKRPNAHHGPPSPTGSEPARSPWTAATLIPGAGRPGPRSRRPAGRSDRAGRMVTSGGPAKRAAFRFWAPSDTCLNQVGDALSLGCWDSPVWPVLTGRTAVSQNRGRSGRLLAPHRRPRFENPGFDSETHPPATGRLR